MDGNKRQRAYFKEGIIQARRWRQYFPPKRCLNERHLTWHKNRHKTHPVATQSFSHCKMGRNLDGSNR